MIGKNVGVLAYLGRHWQSEKGLQIAHVTVVVNKMTCFSGGEKCKEFYTIDFLTGMNRKIAFEPFEKYRKERGMMKFQGVTLLSANLF